MKRILSIIVACLCCNMLLLAVKATPNPIIKKQSDGTELTYYLRGDEKYSYMITDDGYLVDFNKRGDLVYARFHGYDLKLSSRLAHNEEYRSSSEKMLLTSSFSTIYEAEVENIMSRQVSVDNLLPSESQSAKFPSKGSPHSLVLLVSFSNLDFVIPNPREAYTALLNEVGYSANGGTGSARDYFDASSYGQFTPTFDVLGPYKLDNPYSYYGGNSSRGNDVAVRQMVMEACKLAAKDIDFRDYDTDGDGYVDNVFVYYAGYNEAEGASSNTIWPHRSVVSNFSLDGVNVYDYACTSELRSNRGQEMCGIGTFCHEFGHVIGLPDFYVTYDQGSHSTLEKWDIMDGGSYTNNGRTPPSYSSYERFFMGWLEPEIINIGQQILEPLLYSNKAYLVAASPHNLDGRNPNPVEFFMLENRQKVGWDELALPGEGMLVEHIYFNKSTWNSNTPNNNPSKMGVQIVYADGSHTNPAGDTYPGNTHQTTCTLTSRAGEQVGETIVNIQEIVDNISFIYGEGGPGDPFIESTNSLSLFKAYKDSVSGVQVLNLKGRNLLAPLSISITDQKGVNFYVRYEGEGEYKTSLYLVPDSVDSTFECTIEMICEPIVTSYDEVRSAYFKMISSEFTYIYPLSWQSPRPVNITEPVARPATDVTPYSFVANWDSVYDASAYYFTLYNIEETPDTRIQTFGGFASIEKQGWKANFSTGSSTYYKSAPMSIIFSDKEDSLVSDTYFESVREISFWLNSGNASGKFKIEGWDGEQWTLADSLLVDATIKNQDFTYEFDSVENYCQFRFNFEKEGTMGMLYFDDFAATTARTRHLTCDDVIVYADNRSYAVTGLCPGTDYFYKLRATDRDFENNKYNNVTDYSNEIGVKTIEGFSLEDKRLYVTRKSGGEYVCYIPDYNEKQGERAEVFIYDISGRMVARVPVLSNEVYLPALIVGNVYVVKYSNAEPLYSPEDNVLRRSTKVTKFYYAP